MVWHCRRMFSVQSHTACQMRSLQSSLSDLFWPDASRYGWSFCKADMWCSHLCTVCRIRPRYVNSHFTWHFIKLVRNPAEHIPHAHKSMHAQQPQDCTDIIANLEVVQHIRTHTKEMYWSVRTRSVRSHWRHYQLLTCTDCSTFVCHL